MNRVPDDELPDAANDFDHFGHAQEPETQGVKGSPDAAFHASAITASMITMLDLNTVDPVNGANTLGIAARQFKTISLILNGTKSTITSPAAIPGLSVADDFNILQIV